jgi:hypothetical protein
MRSGREIGSYTKGERSMANRNYPLCKCNWRFALAPCATAAETLSQIGGVNYPRFS